MQLNRIGNIEQESDLLDLDQIGRDMESELEDEAVDVQPEPSSAPPQAARPVAQSSVQQNMFAIVNGRGGKGASKFMPQVQVRSNFWPGQPFMTAKQDAPEPKRDLLLNPLKPAPLLDSKFDARLRQKPANDSKHSKLDAADAGRNEPNAPKSPRSRFARATVEALLSIGALPMAMLVEIGRFRQAKENRFFSAARLERALGQGNDDAQRFAAAHPNLVKKKDFAPPAPVGPT